MDKPWWHALKHMLSRANVVFPPRSCPLSYTARTVHIRVYMRVNEITLKRIISPYFSRATNNWRLRINEGYDKSTTDKRILRKTAGSPIGKPLALRHSTQQGLPNGAIIFRTGPNGHVWKT